MNQQTMAGNQMRLRLMQAQLAGRISADDRSPANRSERLSAAEREMVALEPFPERPAPARHHNSAAAMSSARKPVTAASMSRMWNLCKSGNFDERFPERIVARYRAANKPKAFQLRAANNGGMTEILLFDEIGYYGVTATQFVKALADAGDGPIALRINSPGGDVFDGYAIYNALRARKSSVLVTVDGIAASAASFIAMAGSTLTMADPSMLMIHNSQGFGIGDRNVMAEMAGVLGKLDGQIAAIYAAKSGRSADSFRTMMDVETWLTASEAKAAGLCDVVSP